MEIRLIRSLLLKSFFTCIRGRKIIFCTVCICIDFFLSYGICNRQNPTNRQTFTVNDLDSFQQSFFNASLPIKMYSAGWPSGENNYARDRT